MEKIRKRPTKYSKKLIEKICSEISTSSKGIHRICKSNEEYPTPQTFFKWLFSNKYPEMNSLYARAREEQAEFMAEEMIEIADDSSQDKETIYTSEGPVTREDKEVTNRSRLRVDTRKWIASKLKPKKYGDKIDIEHSGEVKAAPLITTVMEGETISLKVKEEDKK